MTKAKNNITRRELLTCVTFVAAAAMVTQFPSLSEALIPATAPAAVIDLRWLEGIPGLGNGTTYGVPWPHGTVAAESTFRIRDAIGRETSYQSIPILMP